MSRADVGFPFWLLAKPTVITFSRKLKGGNRYGKKGDWRAIETKQMMAWKPGNLRRFFEAAEDMGVALWRPPTRGD